MPIAARIPAPYWVAPNATLHLGDVRECLRALPARSVHCVVTSPPYWGLRDYGTGSWEGGSAECDHRGAPLASAKNTLGGGKGQREDHFKVQRFTVPWKNGVCGKCGARRIDQQIGAEPSPEEYINTMVEVFHEVKRVLRDDGTLWLNLGDKIDGGPKRIPVRVAMALESDGWLSVQDIIWHKPNAMPEPCTKRCSKSYEYIFLMAKSNDYYFDSVAIEVDAASNNKPHKYKRSRPDDPYQLQDHDGREDDGSWGRGTTANKRDVWIVSTKGYPGAHYACFSPQLIVTCILAGTSECGCCMVCARPYERVVVRVGGETNDKQETEDIRDRSFNWSRNGKPGCGSTMDGVIASRETVGWRKMCGCSTNKIIPCVVLDPFVGSGTTVATSLELGRTGIGIDLSEAYLKENAIPRIEAAMVKERVKGDMTVLSPPQQQALKRMRGS